MKVLKNILSIASMVAAAIFTIYMAFHNTSDPYQYMILSLLILLTTTSLLMDIQYTSKFEHYFENLDKIIDSSTIQSVGSVDLCAKELSRLVSTGTHTVDFISIDTEIRTSNNKKSQLMHGALKALFQNKNVSLKYITQFRVDTIERFIENIDLGNLHDKDNIYAYFDSTNAIPFATFLVIDSQTVITRSPYEAGQDATYIIIRNPVLAKHYKQWAVSLWNTAHKIESADDIDNLYSKIKDEISENQRSILNKHINSIKKKMEKTR